MKECDIFRGQAKHILAPHTYFQWVKIHTQDLHPWQQNEASYARICIALAISQLSLVEY